ncbi:MAG TPA: hypothetical protein PKO06_16735 [Candidatus Ozemobacteraceae bacterium]|nr:hypothetical protein [Candidatus Ozemobacteraceae bacterium]
MTVFEPRDHIDSRNQQRGSALVLVTVICLIVAVAAGGWWYWSRLVQQKKAKGLEDELQTRLNEGNAALEQGKMDEAYKAFLAGRRIFDDPIFLAWRTPSTGPASPASELTDKSEVDQLLTTISLFKAYDEAFQLKPAAEWAGKAEEHAKSLSGPAADDTRKRVATARSVAQLIELYRQKKYETVLKDLLTVEKNSQSGDRDFFIMEVRLLIACGKGLKQPDIVAQARKLLFFLQFEARLEDSRLDQLWSLLG